MFKTFIHSVINTFIGLEGKISGRPRYRNKNAGDRGKSSNIIVNLIAEEQIKQNITENRNTGLN